MGNRYDDERTGRASQYGIERDARFGERQAPWRPREEGELRQDDNSSQGYESRGERDRPRGGEQVHGENRFDWGTQTGSRGAPYRAAAGWGGTGWGGGGPTPYPEPRYPGFPGRDPNSYRPTPQFNAPTRWGQPDDQYWQGQQPGPQHSPGPRQTWSADFDRSDADEERGRAGPPHSSGFQQHAQHGVASAFESVKEGIRNAFRGLKGYTRSDERIHEDVCDRINHLSQRTGIDAGDVEVRVKDGEVTLSGTIPSRHHKHLIENEADGVSGVREVHNVIRVRREGSASSGQPTATSVPGTGASSSASALPGSLSAGAEPSRTRTPNGSTTQQNS